MINVKKDKKEVYCVTQTTGITFHASSSLHIKNSSPEIPFFLLKNIFILLYKTNTKVRNYASTKKVILHLL